LFKHLRYADGPTGHYNGHTVAMTGNYTNTGLNLNINPEFPTVFEYYRKHSDPMRSAVNAWWLSVDLGPYPSLNYSRHPLYGAQYGANYLMPLQGANGISRDYLGGLSTLHPEEFARVGGVRNFLDGNFDKTLDQIPSIRNEESDKLAIQKFQQDIINGVETFEMPLPSDITSDEASGDLWNIAAAWKVMDRFQPELLVVNTSKVDIGHDDYSTSIQMMHQADYGIGWLWQKIQDHPMLQNNTVMICMPEHGRNELPNTISDGHGLFAYDHTNDENSRNIFGLIVGPPGKVEQDKVFGTASAPVGESIDIVPTIGHILGFLDGVPPGFLPGRVLTEAFL
jgi:hypothetical protein